MEVDSTGCEVEVVGGFEEEIRDVCLWEGGVVVESRFARRRMAGAGEGLGAASFLAVGGGGGGHAWGGSERCEEGRRMWSGGGRFVEEEPAEG